MNHPVRKTGRALSLRVGAAAVAVVAAGALLLAARPDGHAADKDDPAPKAAASPLDFVPGDAVAVVSVRVADLWTCPALKAVLAKEGADLPPLRELSKSLGVPLDEVERVTVVEESAQGKLDHQFVAVTTLKPYDKKAILGTLAPDAKEVDVGDRSFYGNPRGQSITFISGNTYILGSPDELASYLQPSGTKTEGPLTPVLQLASEKHVLIAGIDAAAVAAAFPKGAESPPAPEWLKPLLKARLASLTVDLEGEVKVSGRVTFKNEALAKDGTAGLNDALDLIRGQFVQMKKALTKDADSPKFTALMEDVGASLRAAKAEQKGSAVEVEAKMKIDPGATTAALTEAVPKVQAAAKRQLIFNDLKQLALAVHGYNDAIGHMPAAAIYDKSGKPLLSWRVMILPYIEQPNLYKQFHLDEPWDSDDNKRLLENMPTTFAPRDSQAFKDHETFFQAFVGKDTVFEPPAKPQPGAFANGLRLPTDIPDGLSNTILFVEAKKAVPWTKPEDVTFDDGKLLPKLGGLSKNGFMAVLCDGSVRTFPLMMKEETLRTWVTRNNGQVRPDPDK